MKKEKNFDHDTFFGEKLIKFKNMISLERKKKIVEALIKYGREYEEDEGEYEEDEVVINPRRNPLGFLFGVIFDQSIRYEKAWKAPIELKKRLGHLDVRKIAKMRKSELEKVLRGRKDEEKSLHRFPEKLADWIIEASKLILSEYKGKAQNIWNDKPTAVELINRLREFKGIGQKKANMAAEILLGEYGIKIRGKEHIDVSYDRHVRRVFLRTGLIEKDSVEEVIKIARQLHPSYPAELDIPAWKIGMKFCHFKNPECNKCPLRKVCPKLKVKVPRE